MIKKITVIILIAFTLNACNKGTTLPPYSTSPIFSAYSSMVHLKDTINSAGDTIWLTAQGNIFDTSRLYGIAATLKATASGVQVSGAYISALNPVFDTLGMYATHLFHWTAVMAFPIPAVAPKTVLSSSAIFYYGLTLSSRTGNQTAADSKTTYAK